MSTAAEPRPRLIAPPALFGVGALVAALLALLFPGLDFGQAEHLARPDPLSAAYLKQVLRSRPGDRPARLLLARQDQALGDWEGARTELGRLAVDSDALGWKARLALLELDRARLAALDRGAPARAARVVELRVEVRRLALGPLDVGALSHLAEVALELDAPRQAAQLYARLAVEDPAAGSRWPRMAARWYRAAGHPDAAAEWYLRAATREASADRPEARGGAVEDVLAAAAVLRAAGRLDRALGLLDGSLRSLQPGDAPAGASGRLLEAGVTLALAAGDLARARRWGEMLLEAAPEDERLLERQLSVELGLRRLPAAFALVARLVALDPNDVRLRRRFAQIAGWAGRNRDALEAWVWLADHDQPGAGEEARGRAITLAKALFAHDQVVAVLQAKARDHALSLPELLELGDALEATGDPEAARTLLEGHAASFADAPSYWRAVTAVAEHVGDAEGALRGVREQIRRFGTRAVPPGREAGLLWELDRPDDALAAARAEAPAAAADDVGFWSLLANLAWTEEDEETALGAYRHLWESSAPAKPTTPPAFGDRDRNGDRNRDGDGQGDGGGEDIGASGNVDAAIGSRPSQPEIAERLLALLGGSVGKPEKAAEIEEVAREAYARSRSPALLLTAIDELVAGDRWGEARSLLTWGDRVAAAELQREPDYWAATARLAEADGRVAAALEAWTRVATLKPGDSDAAEGLQAARAPIHDERTWTSGGGGGAGGSDPGDRLARALEQHDRRAVRALLGAHARELTLSERVDGELELGHDGRAWAMLTAPEPPIAAAAGSSSSSAGSDRPDRSDREEVAALAAERHALELERQHGGAVGGGFEGIGSVNLFEQRASVELVPGGSALLGGRLPGAFAVQGLVEVSELRAADGAVLRALATDEVRAGVGATYSEAWGDSRIRLGGISTAAGALAFGSATQHLEWTPELTLDLDAAYHQLPTDTGALRVAGLRNGLESDLLWHLGERLALVASAGAHEYTARTGAWLGTGATGHLELGGLLRAAAPRVRVRVDGFVEASRLAAGLPPSLVRVVQPGTALDSVVPGTYETVGVGASVMNLLGDEPDPDWGGERPRATEDELAAAASHRRLLRLRPFADLWAGWLLPAQKLTYTVNAGLGLPLARGQDLAAAGFFESDRAGEPGQRYFGVSISYSLRWR